LRSRPLGLEAKRYQLIAEMERLALLKHEQRNLNEDWNEEENRRQTEAARQKRAAAERKTEEIKAARSEAALATERAEHARADVEMRTGLVTEIEQRERSLQELRIRSRWLRR
jgi:hypothetical protein